MELASRSGLAASWTDRLGRELGDLRISVTDRCNFRCGYCLPRDKTESRSFLPRSALLDFEEITRIAGIFVSGGVKKLRLTGGEPLLRKELPTLVAMLRPLGAELALTTNGVLLPKLAQPLKDAGLHRLTVSLDALDPEIFQRTCDAPGFSPQDVLAGIEAAERAGFESIKINCVVRRGLNDEQPLVMARHFRGSGHPLRFIEFMDVGTRNGWEVSEVVSEAEIIQKLVKIGSLTALAPRTAAEVARRFVFSGTEDEVGFISSVTKPFCGECSRARLSADGTLYSCLFATEGKSLRGPLRDGATDDELRNLLMNWWGLREDRYSQQRVERRDEERVHLPIAGRVEMSYIGG